MNMSKNEVIESVTQSISRLSNLNVMSNNLKDLILNFKLLILYFTHDNMENIAEWLMAYDVQSHMTVTGTLVACSVHPNTLPTEEQEVLEEDIKILTNFVEHVRKYVKEVGG